jgi:hypothetical protein
MFFLYIPNGAWHSISLASAKPDSHEFGYWQKLAGYRRVKYLGLRKLLRACGFAITTQRYNEN